MNLSPHFTLAEFTKSQTALRKGIDNTPPPAQVENLWRLCTDVLEPVRAAIRQKWPTATVRITSGFRCVALNKAVGGAPSSAHIDGRAGDIEVWVDGVEQDVLVVFEIVRHSGVPFDQLIQECGPTGWNHVAIASAGSAPRGELLAATGSPGKWKYRAVA